MPLVRNPKRPGSRVQRAELFGTASRGDLERLRFEVTGKARAALIQILLPLTDNDDRAYPPAMFARVRQELLDACGGVTAQLSAPAQGVWREEGAVVLDSIVVFEAMVQEVDAGWWAAYRQELELRFRQREIVVRMIPMQRL